MNLLGIDREEWSTGMTICIWWQCLLPFRVLSNNQNNAFIRVWTSTSNIGHHAVKTAEIFMEWGGGGGGGWEGELKRMGLAVCFNQLATCCHLSSNNLALFMKFYRGGIDDLLLPPQLALGYASA